MPSPETQSRLQVALRTADLINWQACAPMLSHLDFSLRSPVLMAALTAPDWKLDVRLPEAFAVTVEAVYGVPVLVLRYQWGRTQAVFLADAGDEGIWTCLDLWKVEGYAQLLLCELDGHSAQRPAAADILDSLRAAAALAKDAEPRVFLAAVGAAIQHGRVARAAKSLLAGTQLGNLETFVIRSRKVMEALGKANSEAVLTQLGPSTLH